MKKFKATYQMTVWYNGGMREAEVTREISARTEKSAENKARKMEASGNARRWYILKSIEEI